MATFFTSDLHFGHRNIIEFCNRPYSSVEEMNKYIITQWNCQVDENDDVFFLGDFGINKKMVFNKEVLDQLNGFKHIILGNHDYGFARSHKAKEITQQVRDKYKKAGWTSVRLERDYILKDGRHVTMTHLPPSNGHDNRYSQYKLENDPNHYYLHGHLHGHYRKNKNMIDVCYDGDLKLWTEEDIIKFINDDRKFIPTRLTEKYKSEESLMLKPFEEEVKKKNLRIHRLISHMTPLTFWSNMKNGGIELDYLQELPEEYRMDAENMAHTLENRFCQIHEDAYQSFLIDSNELGLDLNCTNPTKDDCRKLGLFIKNKNPEHGAAYFAFLKNQQDRIEQYVMKRIRPVGNVL